MKNTDGYRRYVTVLFVDLVDFTAISESIGEEVTYELANQLTETMAAPVRRNLGFVENFAGDGILALFGVPDVLEDAEFLACKAALEVRDAVVELSDKLKLTVGRPLAVRVGIYSGPLVVGSIDRQGLNRQTVLGDTVNVASRLEALASPGQILISDQIARKVAGRVELETLGLTSIRGRKEPVELHRLMALSSDTDRFNPALQRGLTPLAGRGKELDQLAAAFQNCRGTTLMPVSIYGDAGIGKTRLLYEFHQLLGDQPHTFLRSQCDPHGQQTPFWPFIDMIKQASGLSNSQSQEQMRARIDQGLAELDLATETNQATLENLLGIPSADPAKTVEPSLRSARTRRILFKILRQLCRSAPVVLCVDDIHWMDNASRDVIDDLLRRAPELPVMIILSGRSRIAKWSDDPRVKTINLRPLPSADSKRIVSELLSQQILHQVDENVLLERAEGNPLFLEELSFLFAEKHDAQHGQPADPKDGANENVIPSTIEQIALNRIGVTTDNVRRALEAAAVAGRQFSLAVLELVLDGDEIVQQAREVLVSRNIWQELHGETYQFRHALIHEAIYNSILRARRQTIHLEVARALEKNLAGRRFEHSELLAHQYLEAKAPKNALIYFAAAGRRALHIYAIDDAFHNLNEAEKIVAVSPREIDQDIIYDVTLDLSQTLYYRGQIGALASFLVSRTELFISLNAKSSLPRLMFYKGLAETLSAESKSAQESLLLCSNIAEELQSPLETGYGKLGLALFQTFWVPPTPDQDEQTTRLCDEAIEAARLHDDLWLHAMALNTLARNALLHGDPKRLNLYANLLLALAEATGDPLPRQFALLRLSSLAANGGDPDDAIAKADTAKSLAISPLDHLMADASKGVALTSANRGPEAYDVLMPLHQHAIANQHSELRAIIDLSLGASMVIKGELSKGVRWIEATRRTFVSWNYVTGIALSHLVLGEGNLRLLDGRIKPPLIIILKNLGFLLRRRPFAKMNAARHLRQAEIMFRGFGAPSWLSWVLADQAELSRISGDNHQEKIKRAEAEDASAEAAAYLPARE
jgi:class 3 adenylate cyclase